MTTPVRSATTPSPIMLLEQLVRFYAQVTAWPGGLVPSDRDQSIVANIFSGPIPRFEANKRKSPAVAFTLGPAPATEPNDPTVNIGVTVSARGKTGDEVLALLWDVMQTVVKPGNVPFVFCPRVHGGSFQLRGIIGPPPVAHFVANPTLGVWRVVRIDVFNQPQLIAPVAGIGGTVQGEVSGEFSIIVNCTAAVMPKPIAAFTVSLAEGQGTIRVWNGQLLLTKTGSPTVTINLAAPADDTLAELMAHNVAPFTLSGLNGAVSARPSLDLVEVQPPEVIEGVGTEQLYVWA